jgi:riboflavin transporter FmnP
MNTKEVAIGIVFSALIIVLNFAVRIPAPYAGFLIYQIWEIPIVAVFFLYGTELLLFVSAVNTGLLLVFFPGALPLGPIYNLLAILSMMGGIGLVKILMEKRALKNVAVAATLYTTVGIIVRTIAMTLVNYLVLRFPAPVGFSLPEPAILVYLPLIAVFNATLALYTIPIGYSIARVVARSIKTPS